MSLLEAIIEYCVQHGLLVGDGVDAFRDFMPEAPDACVSFHEYSGDPPSPFIDVYHRSVQVQIRDRSPENAKSKALELYKIFKSDTEDLRVDFTFTLWGQVYIRQLPFKLKQDESDRTVYCFNLGITTNILE